MWFVYILRCSDNTLYTGITTDIERRLEEHNTSNMINKYKSLYTGAKFATGYKVLQRTYKYGGQSILSDYFGKFSNNKLLNQAVSGAVIGAGEVILLPLDVLKIQMQTNAKSLTNKKSLLPLHLNPITSSNKISFAFS